VIQLPPKGHDPGRESRLLLAECRGPAQAGYNLSDATQCMQLMDVVLWNRVDNPRPFLAKHPSLLAVITAPGQFQGFQSYPNYSHDIVIRIQQMIDIANNPKDPRHATHASHVRAAIQVSEANTIDDPSPDLVAWRTGGSSSPGPNFTFYRTVLGIDFYSVSAT
jgi:hypothetical protein